ncbi:cytochrome P450 2B4-like [Haliotis asinina]|uniref:cytochrome P450 2B4-like n=1 Tax=Haliotis asinina TaxID=109174 RepID=UPI0035323AE5
MLVVAFFAAILTILYRTIRSRSRDDHSNLPPGPKPRRITGNLRDLKLEKVPLELEELGRPYGGIFTFYVFSHPVVVLHSYKLIKEMLESSEYSTAFSGRIRCYAGINLVPEDIVFQTNTERWQLLRKIAHRGIKQYGTSLLNVERHAQEELQRVVARLTDSGGRPYDCLADIHNYVCNVILILAVGRRFDPGEDMLEYVNNIVDGFNYITHFKRSSILDTMPWTALFPTETGRTCKDIKTNRDKLITAIELMKERQGEAMPDCLYTMLLREHDAGRISMNAVKGVLLDGLVAGVLTTRGTLYTMLLTLVHNPDVQKKIQEEILQVVGKSSPVRLQDRSNMPYTRAAIFESLRFTPPVALPPMRTCIRDTCLFGFHIPRKTMVWYNIWFVHHDPSFWNEPYTYIPERFLDEHGQLVPPEDQRRQRLLTFGIGKRQCVGEILARVRLFLGVVTILQHFHLEADPDHPLPSPDPRDIGFTAFYNTPQYKIRFRPREDVACKI